MTLQSCRTLELISADTARLSVLVRTLGFVQCQVIVGIKVLVAFFTVVMELRIFLVGPHLLCGVKGRIAVYVCAWDRFDVLK